MPRFRLFLPLIAAFGMFAGDAPPVLRKAPEFVIHGVNQPDRLLSSYRGKVVVFLMVHTTCPHCQHDSQIFSQLYTEFRDKGFEPVAVAWNEGAKDKVQAFVAMNHVNFPMGYSSREEVCDFLKMSPVERSVVPQIVWLDRQGNIRSQTPPMGDENLLKEPYWRSMINTLTGEPSGSAKRMPHSAMSRK